MQKSTKREGKTKKHIQYTGWAKKLSPYIVLFVLLQHNNLTGFVTCFSSGNIGRYLSVNSPELIFDLVNAKPGTNHSTNPTNPNGNSKR